MNTNICIFTLINISTYVTTNQYKNFMLLNKDIYKLLELARLKRLYKIILNQLIHQVIYGTCFTNLYIHETNIRTIRQRCNYKKKGGDSLFCNFCNSFNLSIRKELYKL